MTSNVIAFIEVSESDNVTEQSIYYPTDGQFGILDNLVQVYFMIFDQAVRSGALPEGMSDVDITRCIMPILADSFAPLSPSLKRTAENLKHFI